MPEIMLAAEVGRPTGSSATRRLRAEGKIPGVVYGHGSDPIPVAVVGRELRTALSGEAGLNTLLDLDVAGTNYLTLARDIQRHPVKGVVTHVDFQIVRRDEVISAEVPVTLVGEAVEVHHADGIIEQQLFNLTVKAKPADIPTVLEVDISGLAVGLTLKVSDITLPAGVDVDGDPEAPVVTGLPPRVQIEAETEEAAAEGAAEGAVPAAEDGAAGAEGQD